MDEAAGLVVRRRAVEDGGRIKGCEDPRLGTCTAKNSKHERSDVTKANLRCWIIGSVSAYPKHPLIWRLRNSCCIPESTFWLVRSLGHGDP